VRFQVIAVIMLEVKIRKYGDPRASAKIRLIRYIHTANIGEKLMVSELGNFSLPILAVVLEHPEPVNPVVVSWTPGSRKLPKPGTQLSLPVTG